MGFATALPSIFLRQRTHRRYGWITGHGKTVFLASLFWDSFFVLSDALRPYSVRAVTAKADDVFYGNAIALQELELPPANPRSKPDPAILEFSNIPRLGSKNTRSIRLTFYDIAGEVFSNDRLATDYASFLKEADDIIFLLDPTHEEFNVLRSARMIDLVNRINQTKKQNIIIALSRMKNCTNSRNSRGSGKFIA